MSPEAENSSGASGASPAGGEPATLPIDELRIGPVAAGRAKRCRGVERVVVEARVSFQRRDADSDGRIGLAGAREHDVAALATHRERAVQARRRRERPFAGQRHRGREWQGPAGKSGDRAERYRGERAGRRDPVLAPAEFRQANVAVGHGELGRPDVHTRARELHACGRAQRERPRAAVLERIERTLPGQCVDAGRSARHVESAVGRGARVEVRALRAPALPRARPAFR